MIDATRQGLQVTDLLARVTPRPIEGISAMLLPYGGDGRMDLDQFAHHLRRTAAAGLKPAVNMDTGYVNLLSVAEREEILRVTAEVMRGRPFVGGVFVEGLPVEPRTDDIVALYCHETERVRGYGGTPIIFQCSALKGLSDGDVVEVYASVADRMGDILGFELGEMFAPFGRIYSLELFEELIQIPCLIGMKHSSLDRGQEWERLALRDEFRPEFMLYTGNDLAIDMVMYGSDYLLGLSTFAPEAFAARDRLWAAGDPRFFGLNDVLQFLGMFAFRPPVPSYKHSAAQFLHLRGRISASATHPASRHRPDADLLVLQEIAQRLDAVMDGLD